MSKLGCKVCLRIAALPSRLQAQGEIPPPEALEMWCCGVCNEIWCVECLRAIDTSPTEAIDCPNCRGGRVTIVHRPVVVASIAEGSRLPRCKCVARGPPIPMEQAREHEMHCPRFLLFALNKIGAIKPGAALTDPDTINALIQLALAHPPADESFAS